MSLRPLICSVVALASLLALPASAAAKAVPFLPPTKATPATGSVIQPHTRALVKPSAAPVSTQTTPVKAITPPPGTMPTATSTQSSGAITSPASALPGASSSTLPRTTVPARPATRRESSSSLSTGAIIAVVLASLLLLGSLSWWMAHWWAYQPAWWISVRHSLAEANLRTYATLSEFADWVRLGR